MDEIGIRATIRRMETSPITASCHCGAVRLEIAEAPEQITSCNCSICHKLGTLWAYYRPDQVRVIAEPGATVAYVWGDRMLALHHCRGCGCTIRWDLIDPVGAAALGADTNRMGVNVRLMDPAVIADLPVRKVDGRSM
jgi:hypothetical protein